VCIFKILRFHKAFCKSRLQGRPSDLKDFDEFMHSVANIYFMSIRKFEPQCNVARSQLLANDSISR